MSKGCRAIATRNVLILTAPIMIRKMSHLNPMRTMKDVGDFLGTLFTVSSGHRNAARNPVSRIWDSQPVKK